MRKALLLAVVAVCVSALATTAQIISPPTSLLISSQVGQIQGSLTQAQLQTLKTDIEANTDPTVIAALAAGNDNAIAAWYNGDASPNYYVWKTLVTVDELREAVDWAEVVTSLTTNDLLSFQLLTASDVDPSNASIRTAFTEIFSVAQEPNSRAALIAIAKRVATNTEKLFASNSGTGVEGDPDTMTFEGNITDDDVRAALNLP